MLQAQSVEKSLWNLLKDLQGKEVLRGYFLVGGTALSLQLGHRISHDIDLFTRADINPIKRSLVYFDDVTESNWLSVKLLNDELSIDKVKQMLIEKMNEYNKKIIEKT